MKAPRFFISAACILLLAGLGVWRLGYEARPEGIVVMADMGFLQHELQWDDRLSVSSATQQSKEKWVNRGRMLEGHMGRPHIEVLLRRWQIWNGQCALDRAAEGLDAFLGSVDWSTAQIRLAEWLTELNRHGSPGEWHSNPDGSLLLQSGDLILVEW